MRPQEKVQEKVQVELICNAICSRQNESQLIKVFLSAEIVYANKVVAIGFELMTKKLNRDVGMFLGGD